MIFRLIKIHYGTLYELVNIKIYAVNQNILFSSRNITY